MKNLGPLDGLVFNHFTLTRAVNIHVIVDRKIHYMQRIVFLFGPEALGQMMNTPHPVVIPLIMYEHGFDVYVFILTGVPGTYPDRSIHQLIKPFTSTWALN